MQDRAALGCPCLCHGLNPEMLHEDSSGRAEAHGRAGVIKASLKVESLQRQQMSPSSEESVSNSGLPSSQGSDP